MNINIVLGLYNAVFTQSQPAPQPLFLYQITDLLTLRLHGLKKYNQKETYYGQPVLKTILSQSFEKVAYFVIEVE